jgi:hypothetical protein
VVKKVLYFSGLRIVKELPSSRIVRKPAQIGKALSHTVCSFSLNALGETGNLSAIEASLALKMVSQRARDRGKKHKAEMAGRLTQDDNPEVIAALAYLMRQFKLPERKPGEKRRSRGNLEMPAEAFNSHVRTLDCTRRHAIKIAKWMLKVHYDGKNDRYYMRRHPRVELEKFGLGGVNWSQLNPDLRIDGTILAFEGEHQDLWLLVKNFLLGPQSSKHLRSHGSW